MTQTEINRAQLAIWIAEAEQREQKALDEYTDAVKLADSDAKAAALEAFERAHQDYALLDYQLRNLEAAG